MRDYIILRVIAKLLIPAVLLYGLYVQFHGDFGPGGGFQAGVIFAAGFILYGLIFGLDELRQVLLLDSEFIAVAKHAVGYGGKNELAGAAALTAERLELAFKADAVANTDRDLKAHTGTGKHTPRQRQLGDHLVGPR